MTRLDLAIAAERALTNLGVGYLKAINDLALNIHAADRYPILSCRAAEHYAGFDTVPVPADIFADLLGQTDGHAQAWVEGRRR